MAPRNEHELRAAWRALAEGGTEEGWRTIPVGPPGPCRVLAGRRFRGAEEALLIGFPPATTVPDNTRLPQARGFRVEMVNVGVLPDARSWIAIVRQPSGNEGMFARMADDIIDLLQGSHSGDRPFLRLFTGRIRVWQAFMEQDHDEILTPSAETGLVGELLVLRELFQAGVAPPAAVESWSGPLDEVHDFRLGIGAMEVKATVTSVGFPAVVGSLEQLDDALVNRLYLVGVRFSLEIPGCTLPEIIAGVRDRMSDVDEGTRADFDDRVLQAGFLTANADRYQRRFLHVETSVFPVGNGFPRLTRRTVHRAVRSARYELDLDLLGVPAMGLGRAFAELQVV